MLQIKSSSHAMRLGGIEFLYIRRPCLTIRPPHPPRLLCFPRVGSAPMDGLQKRNCLFTIVPSRSLRPDPTSPHNNWTRCPIFQTWRKRAHVHQRSLRDGDGGRHFSPLPRPFLHEEAPARHGRSAPGFAAASTHKLLGMIGVVKSRCQEPVRQLLKPRCMRPLTAAAETTAAA